VFDFHLAAYVAERGIIPGIRANGELTPLPGSPNEFMVQGLDGLLPRLQAARAAGCRFSKWRVPIACTGGGLPTETGLEMQAETLARFAAVSQEAGLVPIVEPDVEFSGDADLSRSVEVHSRAIELVYERCRKYNVLLEGMSFVLVICLTDVVLGTLLKSSYAQPGLMHPSRANTTPSEIALATDTVISRSVPTAVPGVVFLSGEQRAHARVVSDLPGGLSASTAMTYLCAVNELANKSPVFSRLPRLSFSYGRALQGEALKHWVTGDEQGAKIAFEKQSKAYFHAAKGIVY
jgi:fructose-bisphosphate aldolase class I